MVFTLISVFQARRGTKCSVWNSFFTSFNILSKMCETVFGLEWFLHKFLYFKQDV